MSIVAAVACIGTAQAQSTSARVDPMYGNIDPFYGNIDPFYGNIDPFYGNIDPFYGNINPFYGNIDPFWGNISPFEGNVTAFWGNIDPFTTTTNAAAPSWGNVAPFWEDLGAYWNSTNSLWSTMLSNASAPSTDYATIGARLNEIARRSESTWGSAYTAATGKSFQAGFAAPLFAKYGIDPNNPATLKALSGTRRAQFFLEWYDSLMAFSGRDRVDHWMKAVNWNPALTQQQGFGADTTIGLIDGSLAGEADLIDNLKYNGGYSERVAGHGAGVASLMVSAHNGKGVMGIAPNAKVAMYNPFDYTGTAGWTDIRNSIVALKGQGASIINMSLGEKGWALSPNMRDVFASSQVSPYKSNTVYVLAAGNDGIVQPYSLDWTYASGTVFLLVGSVDASGTISQFSNRPGYSCLYEYGLCKTNNTAVEGGGYMMKNFLVAPGEQILVADGQGGVVRRTGTSFAAPLVAGAIALLHDRWPWLASKPKESAEIILRSAKDLGAPGVDPVYGWGMLDVTASQSPLNFNNLTFYQYRNGYITQYSARQMKSGGYKSTWEVDGVYFSLFETIGSTQRDWVVPMSSRLSGSVYSQMAGTQAFQRFLTQRMTDWLTGVVPSLTDVRSYAAPAGNGWQMTVSSGSPTEVGLDGSHGLPHSAVRLQGPEGRFAFTSGYGQGGMALVGQNGFGLVSDYRSDGGVNPLLGLASGGAFFNAEVGISPRTTVSVGYTEKHLKPEDNLAFDELERQTMRGLAAYNAEALNLRIAHRATDRITVSVGYTRLREKNALLAVQSFDGELDNGSVSDNVTLGANVELPHGLTLAASANAGRSRTVGVDQAFRSDNDGVLTTAFAASATKLGVLGKRDMLRLSVVQPLHIEKGNLSYQSVEVVDRQTGDIGVVERPFEISGKPRRYTSELLYAAPVLHGDGEVSLFGRAAFGSDEPRENGVIAGAKFKLRF